MGERAEESGGVEATAGRVGPVSAVVCNYNGEGYLAACLESILSLEGGVDEVIVVDNGSFDGSVELVRGRFPSVRILELGSNLGPCVARNAGMRLARNRWVLAIDNDAVPRADVLLKLRAALEADPEAAAAQPRSVVAEDVDRVHYDGARFHYVGLFSLRNFYCDIREAEGHGVVPADGLIAIAVLLDRDVVFRCGAYDEDFFILFEDFDLSLRMRIAGCRLLSVEDAICLHRAGTPGISFRGGQYPQIRAYYHSRNRWLLLVKNYHWRTILASLPGILVYELVWAVFTFRKRLFRPHMAGKLAFFRALPKALEKRRVVQANRRVPDRDLLVGGPLTFWPKLLQSPFARFSAATLDLVLRGWWVIGRIFAA